MIFLCLIATKRIFTIIQHSTFSLSRRLSEPEAQNPIFQHSPRGVGPTGRRPIVSGANYLGDTR